MSYALTWTSRNGWLFSPYSNSQDEDGDQNQQETDFFLQDNLYIDLIIYPVALIRLGS